MKKKITYNKIKVLVYPKATNPHQDLLYGNKSVSDNCEIKYINLGVTKILSLNLLIFPLRLLIYRLRGFKIFHLHWFYEFQAPPHNGVIIRSFFTIYVIITLLFIKLIRYKLVYTVHDYFTHDKQFVKDEVINNFVFRLSDAVITQDTYTFNKITTSKAKKYFIPIGNYNDVYPNTLNRTDARKKLRLSRNTFIFLFFGRIEKYKGIERLIDAFDSLTLSNAHLLIVGPCTSRAYVKKLQTIAKNNKIKLLFKYIQEKDVQLYFQSADIVVLPFTRITSSSTVLLAYSFKKPTILPQFNELQDIPKNTCFFYNPSKEDQLKSVMSNVYSRKDEVRLKGTNAYRYTKTLSWNRLSEELVNIYKCLR